MIGIAETLAHQLRGVAFAYFALASCRFFRIRKRSRRFHLLFLCTLWIAAGYLKDSVFLSEFFSSSEKLNVAMSLLDLTSFPVICAFLLEVVRPGAVKDRLWISETTVILLLAVLYLIFPLPALEIATYAVSYSIALSGIAAMVVFSVRYGKYLSDNFSYKENMEVRWAVVTGSAWFLQLVIYAIAFTPATWLGECLFIVSSLVIWSILFYFVKRQRTVRIQWTSPEAADKGTEDDSVSEFSESIVRNIEITIAPRLASCMQEDKIYLNPKLKLGDLAAAVGTNVKYLTYYLQHSLGTSFYDYINSFRVEEACRIIREMESSGRINMTDVAIRSGFNSVSSFNRYFFKIMSVSPKAFYTDEVRKGK